MSDRPLEDVRPIGPVFTRDSDDSEDTVSESESEFEIPDQVDRQNLADLKSRIERTTNTEPDMQDALALHVLEAPMLQSYVSNTLERTKQVSDNTSVQSVIESDATKEYARKLGAREQLEKARSVYS